MQSLEQPAPRRRVPVRPRGRQRQTEDAEAQGVASIASSSPAITFSRDTVRFALQARVQELGPWFHNLRLGEGADVQTAPDHPLGDFPSNFWEFFKQAVPDDLTGQSVLDIGCNGGFYSFEMKRRGAARVLGVDHDPVYLAQARFAAEAARPRRRVHAGRRLRHRSTRRRRAIRLRRLHGCAVPPAPPAVRAREGGQPGARRLLFQTMERGSWDAAQFAADYPIHRARVFFDDRFPRMYFVEHAYAGDSTNWWIPESGLYAGAAAIGRAAGGRSAVPRGVRV